MESPVQVSLVDSMMTLHGMGVHLLVCAASSHEAATSSHQAHAEVNPHVQVSLVDDIMMLHGMGVRLILVLGASPQMNDYLRLRGSAPQFVKGYRVTDELAMEAAMEAAGFNRILFEALLSKVREV
jgi:hypothetical protein